jgi:hypothetical protein
MKLTSKYKSAETNVGVCPALRKLLIDVTHWRMSKPRSDARHNPSPARARERLSTFAGQRRGVLRSIDRVSRAVCSRQLCVPPYYFTQFGCYVRRARVRSMKARAHHACPIEEDDPVGVREPREAAAFRGVCVADQSLAAIRASPSKMSNQTLTSTIS